MITRKQSIEHFSVRMDELISSNYLLSDKKITNVLKTVTTSKLFYELISYTAEGFNYTEYLGNLPKGEFFPTSNKKKFIALGFCLFSEIDCKNEDLLNILSLYYGAENFDKSYKLFTENFLIPFKNTVVSVAKEMISRKEEIDNEQDEQVINFAEVARTVKAIDNGAKNNPTQQPSKKYLSCYKDIQRILISEKGKIIHCRQIKDNEKNDLLVLLDTFSDCLTRGNKPNIKTSFISYKYAVQAFKKIESEAEDIERILKFCGAI